jgi:chromosome segregation ATPase
MAKTVIGFEIDIEGIDDINKLNAEIKETNQALKKAKIGTEEYSQTAEKLAKLKAEQKALRKQQTDLTKSFLEQTKALSTYDKASAKLNRLRKEFKNLAFEGKESTKEGKRLREEIGKLDKQLKSTDAKVGQFQRSVGNYPRIFGLSTKSLGQFIPGLDQLSERLDKATGGSNILGKALIGGFVAFQAGKFLIDAFKQFDELIKKIDETKNAVSNFAGVGGAELDSLTASVTALSTTFEVDAEQINKSAAALSKELGISFEEALTKIESGLLAGQASNEEFLSSIQSTPGTFQDVEEAASSYSKRQKELLEANKEALRLLPLMLKRF